jgi:hypothetical protein
VHAEKGDTFALSAPVGPREAASSLAATTAFVGSSRNGVNNGRRNDLLGASASPSRILLIVTLGSLH